MNHTLKITLALLAVLAGCSSADEGASGSTESLETDGTKFNAPGASTSKQIPIQRTGESNDFSLCKPEEVVDFNCPGQGRGETISICSGSYRFGSTFDADLMSETGQTPVGYVELALIGPPVEKGSDDASGDYWTYRTKDGFEYRVWHLGEEAGVEVLKNGKPVGSKACESKFIVDQRR